MKRHIAYLAIAAAAVVAATPAEAVVIVPGSSGLTFSAFDPNTRGTQLAIQSQSGSAPTIAGTLLSAVYRNDDGFLDFYFQVSRTSGSNQIDGMNVGAFDNLLVDGFVDGSDFDGDGPFAATNNPEGSTTTVGRSANGDVVRIDFGANGLAGTENGATYILRTNAVGFNDRGFATVTNSTSFNVDAYQPAAVPEPETWGLMMIGFGLVGTGMRRRRRSVQPIAA
jgi:hypothetical protein